MRFRSLLVGSLLTAGLVAGFRLLHAQNATTTDQSGTSSLTATNVDWSSLSDAQIELLAIEQVQPTPYSQLSESDQVGGTFWSAQHSPVSADPWPPLPADLGQLSVWSLSTNNQDQGVFLLNDLAVNYNSSSATTTQTAGTMQTLDTNSPPSPGGTNDYSTNSASFDISYTPIDTNGLWLQINGVSNGLVYLTLHNTTNTVQYQILSQEALSNAPMSSWDDEGSLFWGSSTTNWTAVTVPQNGRSNLFLSAQSQIDSTGTGIPDWWWLLYYGQDTNVSAYADPSGDGWNNLEKYQLGMNPNLFYTPPAPQGLTASYNSYNNTATVSWQPSSGGVTSYTVEKDDSYARTAQDFNIPVGQDYFVDNVTNAPDPGSGNMINVSYKVQALYGTNTSYWGGPVPLEQNSLSASFIAGPQGSAYVAVSSLPPGTAALRVTRLDENFLDYYTTNFDIPISASSNGLYLIPASWDVMQPDANGDSYAYAWFVQTLNTNGTPNAQTSVYRGYTFYTEDDRAWLEPPYFDGREQLKQNLIFLLRAAVTNSPFDYMEMGYFYGTNHALDLTYFSNPANYAYAGFYQLDENGSQGQYFETYESFDAYWPFENNYRYRNFVFNASELDSGGRTTTGAGGNYDYNHVFDNDFPGGLMVTFPPAYMFQAPSTNGTQISALLATNQTQWLVSYALDSADSYLGEIGISTNTEGAFTLPNTARNIFGLPFLSAEIAYNNGGNVGLTKLGVNGATTQSGYFYPETEQPLFQTNGYDFWAGSWVNNTLYSGSPLPGMTNFSTSQPSDLLIVGMGNSIMVNGYAKLKVANGYAGVYGYLGQYFDQAYQIDDTGNVTTNTTGVLSSYGQFFPTQPGPAALETMPDPDTGAQGTCTVYCISLALDANHDGTMDTTFGGPDGTSQANPYVFWANNNYDRWSYDILSLTNVQEDLDPSQVGGLSSDQVPDCDYTNFAGNRVIPDTRDLEDFARLWVCGVTSNLLAALPAGSTVTLNWGDVGSPNSANPTIDIFQAVESDGGIGYLTNETIANEQIDPNLAAYVGRLGPGGSIQLNASELGQSGNWLGDHYIWCGVSNGVGQLNLTIMDASNNVLAQASQWIQIVDIKQMYERWTVGDDPNIAPTNTPMPAATDLPINVMQQPFLYPTNTIPGTPYILFVHGWNLTPYDKDRDAETAFKRLYWQGYQGRFGEFRWPTTLQDWEHLDPRSFDNGELLAWQSGAGLLNLLTNLDAEYQSANVYLMAHSQGNVVAGEALRQATQQGLGQVVNTYVAMQAAVAAHAYDPTTPDRYTPQYPDDYAQYWTNSAPCYFNGTAGAGTYVNFFNTNDFALVQAWEPDEDLKPDYGYFYNGTNFYYQPFLSTTYLYFPQDTYPIFSYCDPAPCYALGAQPDVGGAFKTLGYNQVELDIPPYNFGSLHIYHSGEFLSDYAQRWQFWYQVLFQMGLTP